MRGPTCAKHPPLKQKFRHYGRETGIVHKMIDYATFTTLDGGLHERGNGDGEFERYERYDLCVQQPVPVFINAIVPGDQPSDS